MSLVVKEVNFGSDEYEKTIDLRQEILRSPLGLQFTREELALERGCFHLSLWQAAELIGCLVLKPAHSQQIQLRQLAIRSCCQRVGHGSTLVAFAEQFAAELAYCEIILHSRESALNFYEHLGYEKVGERYFEVTIPHFTMRKTIH